MPLRDRSIRQEMRESLALSKQSGQRIRKVFNRKKFLEEFPNANSDPRMAFTPDNFIMDVTPMEAITVGELRKFCLAKRDHPQAIHFALATAKLSETQIVYVLRQDLNVLREGLTAQQIEVPDVPIIGSDDGQLEDAGESPEGGEVPKEPEETS